MVGVLGCRREGFPQTYLGLPLSNEKLKLASFAPLICKFDRYLSGWQAPLLNHMARAVLVNSVLDSLPTYAMMALELPPGVIAAMDGRRRSFLWSGEEKASGADCLIAWAQVTNPTTHGGLGVRDLAIQNRCLLMKLMHRLHCPTDSSWAAWATELVDVPSMVGELSGQHWDALRSLLPAYQELTQVSLGNGRTTSFWRDAWSPYGRLADLLPALFSHSNKPAASVHTILSEGIHRHLVPRLTAAAAAELTTLEQIVAMTELRHGVPDRRSGAAIDESNRLRSGLIYKALVTEAAGPCPYASFVWHNCSPPKVQFFMWLLVQGRIKSRMLLHVKHVVTDTTCELCCSTEEDADHIIFGCHIARSFWDAIGGIPTQATVRDLHSLSRPPTVPARHKNVFLHLCCWNLWKHRNEVVFQKATPCLRRLLLRCRDEANLWRCRLPAADADVSTNWCTLFSSIM